jgi:sodium/potassium-transporting ATPase subunit alpha
MTTQVHNLAPDQVHRFLHSRHEGLNRREVAERRRVVGANTLEVRRRFDWMKSLARQFTNFFSLLLDLSAVICFVADGIQPGEGMNVLGWALLAVSLLNAAFSFVQEYRAERAMAELQKFLPRKVTVRREGREIEIAAADLVPGDILQVREGVKVPADARLIDCQDLTVNNAPLTGESKPVHLTAEAVDTPFATAHNVIFAGGVVLRGFGEAVVFATGFRTEFGRIAMLSHEVRRKASPLEIETGRMVRVLTVVAVAMGLIFFAYGIATGRSLWVNLVFMMGIIVANVPEGLLPTFTLSLAMGSLRMAKRNVLVKGLNAVEALGAVDVVCTDKTGTLTLNRLAVSRLAGPISGEEPKTARDRIQLLRLALTASDVRPSDGGFVGDPLDVAVAEAYEALGRKAGPVVRAIRRRSAFDPERRRAAGVARRGKAYTLAVKGAWESLRPLLAHVDAPEGGEPLKASNAAIKKIDAVVGELAGVGYRVIAVASGSLDRLPPAEAGSEALERGLTLTLAGFLCLEDPIRPEVPDAVARCREAGIQVMMITGDHPRTAESVARRIGIVAADAEPGSAVLTGEQLAGMRRRSLIAALRKGVTVFARTTPEQKWKIVSALHGMDKVVAVTGDGVNDAPALKAADVGIAMGKGGTDVAREAAQVVLLDDNFASIVAGVEEGRTIFANIRKFTNYVLVSNGPEILPYLLFMLFPVPLALTVIQILSIDLGTDIVPSMGLGQEKPDPDVMRQPPRDRRQGLLTWPMFAHSYLFLGLIEAAFALGLFFWVLSAGGWQWGEELGAADPLYRSATGITLSSIILMQIGNLLGRRSRYGSGLTWDIFGNRLIVLGVAFEVVFSWAILYFPPLSAVLGTGPVDLTVYAAAWFGVPLIFGLDYGRKRIACRLTTGRWRHRQPASALG